MEKRIKVGAKTDFLLGLLLKIGKKNPSGNPNVKFWLLFFFEELNILFWEFFCFD
jgi:hypothetical protein